MTVVYLRQIKVTPNPITPEIGDVEFWWSFDRYGTIWQYERASPVDMTDVYSPVVDWADIHDYAVQ